MRNTDDKISPLHLMPGETVEVRSQAEILQTLDADGALDGLPFMPEMLQYCGQGFQVYRRADKTCDTIDNDGGLRMRHAVHLADLRCDGANHGGCQAWCSLFWKEAWLKRPGDKAYDVQDNAASETTINNACRTGESPNKKGELVPVYSCQATQLKNATTKLNWWDIRQYVRDVRIGNASVAQVARAALFAIYRKLVEFGLGYRYLIRFYDRFQERRGGLRFPFRTGQLDGDTPTLETNLKIGEWVRVKPVEEILETLDKSNKNRGLWFDAEMTQYCGKEFRVVRRVSRIINEKSGKMMSFKNPCIGLENAYCQGRFTKHRLFCPRRNLSYWRELWLDRLSEAELQATGRTSDMESPKDDQPGLEPGNRRDHTTEKMEIQP